MFIIHRYIVSIIFAFLITTTDVLADQDLSYVRSATYKITALSPELLEKVYTLTYEIKDHYALQTLGQLVEKVDEYFEDFQVLEAYTLKANGRKIHITPEKILVSKLPEALDKENIFEGDIKARTLIFPSLSVGDRIYVSVKRRMKETPRPGGFRISEDFISDTPNAHVELSLDVPESFNIHKDIRGFSEKKIVQNGRTVHMWTKKPYNELKTTEHSSDNDLHILISTYPDNETFEKIFFENAALKSKSTHKIRVLADRITKNSTDRRAQAEAIYDWITRNIRYVSLTSGNEGSTPRDVETILSTKYGDCKDYTALMRSFLTAKGIPSDFVLINDALPSYKKPSIPGGLETDHVILYLPEFDLYIDPIVQSSSFHYLPLDYYGKHVLRASKEGVILTQIPPIKPEVNRLTFTTNITFRSDGTPYGTSTLEATGPSASNLRDVVANKHFPQLEGFKWYGTASIEETDPMDHKEPYVAKISFDLTNKFFGDLRNGYSIPTMQPIDFEPIRGPLESILSQQTEKFTCSPGTYKAIFNIMLPKGITLKNLPPERNIQTSLASYKTRHRVNGQKIRIERHFISKVPGPICTPDTAKTLEKILLPLSYDTLAHLAFEKTRS